MEMATDFSRSYDCIIIGGGPAGITATIYACRAGLDVLVIEKLYEGGQLANIHKVDNYPGFCGTEGVELTEKLIEHAHQYAYEFVNEEATEIKKDPDLENGFLVVTEKNIYKTKTIIITTGAKPKKLGAKGEEKFTGRGVSFCAVCDGAFFRDKDVAVIGGGNTAAQDALYLSRVCRKVYLVHRRDKLRAENHFIVHMENTPNIEIIYETVLDEICGKDTLEGVKLKSKKTGEKYNVSVSGVFIATGISPDSDFMRGFIDLDDSGFVRTDAYMRTNVPGVFAAGDVRTSPLRQIITASADGAVAADSARAYLDR